MSSIPKNIQNNLHKFSGEDFSVIRVCSSKVQLYFSVIGLFVLIILFCCFVSALYFTEHLFNNAIADIGVGIIWGYIVTNLYVLLLYTITPSLLPKKDRKKNKEITKSYDINFSMILRIGLVILLAIITAQPLNIFLLKPDTQAFAFDIRNLLAHNPFAWVITILVITIFVLPIYLKYSIRKLGEFYEKKAEIEQRIIVDDYQDFRAKYRFLLESNILKYNKQLENSLIPFLNRLAKINIEQPKEERVKLHNNISKELTNELMNEKIEKYEYWADPPYRTKYKSKIKNILTEQDLLNHIYPETD